MRPLFTPNEVTPFFVDPLQETGKLGLQKPSKPCDSRAGRAIIAPSVLAAPSDLVAREATQSGAWACGTVLGQVSMTLHHKLCHTLGAPAALRGLGL